MGVGGQHRTLATLPLGKRPHTNCTGGLVGPRAGLNGCRKSHPHWDLILRLPVASPYTDCAILNHAQ